MIYYAKKMFTWLISYFTRKQKYRSEKVEELPDALLSNTIYIVGEERHIWFVAMKCPCGCEETLYMNTQKESSPSWSLTEGSNKKTISLYPSVWRKVGCKSHFFLRNGSIIWCE